MGVTYLCSSDASSPWSVCAVTTLTDALPLLCWQMLCRPYFARSGGYFAALVGRLRRMLRRCGAASSGGCLATLWLISWSQSAPSVMFVLRVGSSLLGHLVGFGGFVRSSLLFCSRRSGSSVAIYFRCPFFSFFSVVSPLCACTGQLLFGLYQVLSVICFPLNEIRAKARSRKKER